MPSTPATRRSRRSSSPKTAHKTPSRSSTGSPQLRKIQTRTMTIVNKEAYLSSWLENYQLIAGEVSDSDLDSDEEESGQEDTESTDLSSDNIVYRSADDLSRHLSYDSRCEPGNEEYEIDEFVVPDDYVSEAGSEATIVPEKKKKRLVRKAIKRKPSATSSTSSSGKLFYSDPDSALRRSSRRSSVVVTPSSTEAKAAEIFISEEPEDIVEQMEDGIALYRRRCNRNKQHMIIMLTASVLSDDRVKEALAGVVQLGLGKMSSSSNGDEVWVIGPAAK